VPEQVFGLEEFVEIADGGGSALTGGPLGGAPVGELAEGALELPKIVGEGFGSGLRGTITAGGEALGPGRFVELAGTLTGEATEVAEGAVTVGE